MYNKLKAIRMSVGITLGLIGLSVVAQESVETPPIGLLDGSVVTSAKGTPVPNAVIEIDDHTKVIYGKTDSDGRFTVELPQGKYDIAIEHEQFPAKTFPAIEIRSGVVQQTVFRLGDPGLVLDALNVPGVVEEVLVLGTYQPGGADKARWSESVLDVITTEDFEVAGDGTAVEALARVTGLTIVNDKYVYVRGMGERYSNTTFNHSLLPSPDPLRRVIPMDLFPTGVLETVEVQKTYAPDQYGDFSGGSVGLRTRSIPDETLRQVQISFETNTETTGVGALTYDGGDGDWTGFDDGFRSLPGAIKRSKSTLAQDLNDPALQTELARSLNQEWGAQIEELPANYGLDLTLGERWNAGGEGSVGALLGVMYKNEYSAREELRQEAQTLTSANPSVQASGTDENYSRTVQTIDLAALLNLEWELNDVTTLRSTTFLTRRTDKTSTRDFFFDENKGSGEDAVSTTYEWEERQLLTQQLAGEHVLGNDQDYTLEWFGSYSKAERDKPDSRVYVYERPGFSAAETSYLLSDDQGSLTREWEELQDEAYGLGFNVSKAFDWGEASTTTVKVGVSYNDKERDTSNIRFEYITSTYEPRSEFEAIRDELIGDVMVGGNLGNNLLELQLNSRNTNLVAENYQGSEQLTGYYVMFDNELGSDWRLMLGARVEDFDMTSEPIVDSTAAAQPASGKINETDVLPSTTLTYLFNDDMQIRFGASRTVNRPDLREIGPVRFVDPETRYSYIGNPALEAATIDNVDLRWEWYFEGQDNVQVALFYKDFSNPIEIEVIPGAPVLRRPYNADAATNQGVELSLRKQLDFIDAAVVRNMYVKFNGAYIDSQVELAQGSALFDSSNRALQGQSEWVVNTQLTWDDIERDIQASLLFNWAAERLVDVGTDNLPGAVEEPPMWLDFVYRQSVDLFGRPFALKFKASNLIDADVKVTRADVTERRYNTGRTFTFGVSADI
ncbi:MAG: TonB-dependent receptor [Gammaproteobacteria bacterium]|nr:TonB-dependent receptor [Gammaproteobacteria bacterium]